MTANVEGSGMADPGAERAAAIKAFQRRDAWRRRLPLLPALLFTILVTQVPFLFNIFFSLLDWKIVPPRGPDFVGLENYLEGYSNTFFLNAVTISVFMTAAAVLLSVLVGTALALLLDRQFFGRGIARTLLITPFLIMPVVAGLLWKNQMFSSTFGVLNSVIEAFGLDAIPFVERYPVLVDRRGPGVAVVALHDADHPGRPAGPADGHPRGGPGRPGQRPRHLHAADPAHAAALPRARASCSDRSTCSRCSTRSRS